MGNKLLRKILDDLATLPESEIRKLVSDELVKAICLKVCSHRFRKDTSYSPQNASLSISTRLRCISFHLIEDAG